MTSSQFDLPLDRYQIDDSLVRDRFSSLRTLDDVKRLVHRNLYRPFRPDWSAELIGHALSLAGDSGLTASELRDVLGGLSAHRLEQALALAQAEGRIEKTRERRPNRAGRLQQQVVLRIR